MRGKTYRIRRTIQFENGKIVFTTLFYTIIVEVYSNGKLLHTETLNYWLDDSVKIINLITRLTQNYLLLHEKSDFYTINIDQQQKTCVFTVRPSLYQGIEVLFQLSSNKYSNVLLDVAYDDIAQILNTCYLIAASA
ncbi:MAG: hypothetical protein UH963_01605 [Agathobacter sp.]|nr:hypothetical protein [Agathobacter sp.]